MRQWHCTAGGQQYGPVDETQLRQWIAESCVTGKDLVWCEGMANWVPAANVPELMGAAPGPAAPPAYQPTAPYAPAVGSDGRMLKPHRGTLVLVMGILSLVVCGVFGPIALSMGRNDLAEIDAGLMDPSGRGTVNAGRICGIIGTIILVLQILYIVFIIVVVASQGIH